MAALSLRILSVWLPVLGLQVRLSVPPELAKATATEFNATRTLTQVATAPEELLWEESNWLQGNQLREEWREEREVQYVLVTAEDGSGKVVVVPVATGEPMYTLISGLSSHVGLCFDSSHSFLYVFDQDSSSLGHLYKYLIRRENSVFELFDHDYFLIYEGLPLTACAVDARGRLYFAIPGESAIYGVSFADLWSSYKNQHYLIYSGAAEMVQAPVILEVDREGYLYWVNAQGRNDTQEVIKAPAQADANRPPTALFNQSGKRVLALAVSERVEALAASDGSIVSLSSPGRVTYLSWPHSLCVCSGQLYIGDSDLEAVFGLKDDDAPFPAVVARVRGLSAVECVQATALLLFLTSALLI